MVMDYSFSEEQEMLRTMARDFLAKECPKTYVREMMEHDEKGYSPEVWKKMADVGWLGLVFPEEYGGTGMGFRDLMILGDEMGRAMLPGPFVSTVLLVGMPILMAGTEEQKKEYLPKIANGDMIGTLAVLEQDGDLWPGSIKTTASRRGDEYIIRGKKLFVPDAKAADVMLCAARTKRAEEGSEDGITLFLANAKDHAVWPTELKTMDMTRKQYEVDLNNVAVPAANIVGELHQGWPVIKKVALQAAAFLTAEMAGGMDWVLETTVEYLKTRIAFGRPLGSFQALKHRIADVCSDCEMGRSLMEWAALCMNSDSTDVPVAVSMAKAFCADAYLRATNAGVQLHGGLGFTWDHDMHLYFKRARANNTAFGDSNYHRELVAQYLNAEVL